jgi:hypothetical protein
VNPTVGLVLFLVVYALIGAAFAFNLWGVSDHSADYYRGKPWLLRQIGRDNPNAWRGGGLIMLVFGMALVVGILALGIWQLPTIPTSTAILLLTAAAITCVVVIVRLRHN